MRDHEGKEAPLFSVIIAAGTQTDWLRDALESLRSQTMKSWEARVVIYEGEARERIEALLSDLGDSRIEIVAECERGSAPLSRNAGARQARGSYLVFLDEDDLYHPAHLEVLSRAWKAHPECGLIYAQCFYFWEGNELEAYIPKRHEGEIDAESILKWISEGYYWPIRGTSTLSFPQEKFRAIGGFDEEVLNTDDMEIIYNTRLRYPIASVPEATVGRRHHFRGRLTRPDAEKVRRTAIRLESKHGFVQETLTSVRLEVQKHNRLYDWGIHHLRQPTLPGRIRQLWRMGPWPDIWSVRLFMKWLIMLLLGMESFHRLMVAMRGGQILADYRVYLRRDRPEQA